MKKLMIAFAATAALVSVASAEDAWFTGTIGSESEGSWEMTPGDGSITTNNNTTLVLEDAAASFEAATPKALSGSANLNFATSAKFAYSYDELPAVDDGAKAGVVVYTNEYYVLAKKVDANDWAPTGIAVDNIEDNVAVSVTISNDNNTVYAIYNIGGTAVTKEVVASGNWGVVDYKGSGEVASLVGTTIPLGWPLPGGGSIAVDPAWAEANGIDAEAFAKTDKLANGFSASESYILGLNTDEAFVATLGKDAEGDKFVLAKPNVKVADRVSFDVYLDGVKAGDGTLPKECFTRQSASSGEHTIQLRPKVSGQDTTGTSQTIGIWTAQMINSNGVDYVTIPYECAVSNCLWNLSNEQHWDYMDVYDAASGNWDRWRVHDNSTTWEYVPTAGRTTPITTVLKPGQAVKITVGDCKAMFGNKKAFYRVGTKVDRAKTAVVSGTWNLVGNPDDGKVSLSLIAGTDKIRAFDPIAADASYHALPDVSYTKYGDNWYKIPLNGTGTVVTEIDSGVKGFFLYATGTEVKWTPTAAK